MKIRSDYPIDAASQLTEGREYVVNEHLSSQLKVITDDEGEERAIFLNGCAHLRGRPWAIVPDQPTDCVIIEGSIEQEYEAWEKYAYHHREGQIAIQKYRELVRARVKAGG